MTIYYKIILILLVIFLIICGSFSICSIIKSNEDKKFQQISIETESRTYYNVNICEFKNNYISFIDSSNKKITVVGGQFTVIYSDLYYDLIKDKNRRYAKRIEYTRN